MRTLHTIYPSESIFRDEEFDLFIACSGYEKRCTYLSETFNIATKSKLCIRFDNYNEVYNRKLNDLYFNENKFEFITSNIDSFTEIREFLTSYVDKFSKEKMKILIDYSSMSRVWYSYILTFFQSKSSEVKEIELTFSYSQSHFVSPPEIAAYKSFVAPIEGYYSILPPIKPTALVLGLGYIERQAFGLSEYFEAEPFVFISKSQEKDLFYDSVVKNNKLLLSKINEQNVFQYSVLNLSYLETILNHLCRDIRNVYRIVLAPCGPKPFTLICFITSIKLGNIDVWRISASNNNKPIDKVANGNISLVKVLLNNF